MRVWVCLKERHTKKSEKLKDDRTQCEGKGAVKKKHERERCGSLHLLYVFALGALILYMLQYALLFICRDIDVSHELAGRTCECV